MITEQGRSLDNKKLTMKIIFLTIFLLLINFNVHANPYSTGSTFCEWKGSAKSIFVKNKYKGLKEAETNSNNVKQHQPYKEQVIIPLIDRIYWQEKNLTLDESAFVEQQQCVIGMISNLQVLARS